MKALAPFIFCLMMLWVSLASRPAMAASQSPEGLWLAQDESGEPTGYIKIVENQGVYTGYIERGLHPEKTEKICTECKDERKNQKLLGMVIMKNVRAKGDVYEGDEILDPFNGNTYRVKLTLKEPNQMEVRGFVGVSLLGRTQVWKRVTQPEQLTEAH